jgi:CheY-like chemotaxis protein
MEVLLECLGKDVRHTLHEVLGMIELVAEEPLSKNQMSHLARCRQGVEQLLYQTNDLIELANPALPAPAAEPFAVAETVTEVVQLMSLLSAGKGVNLKWTLDAKAPDSVSGDRTLLQEVLRRSLDHSIRSMEAGEVSLSVSAAGTGTSLSLVFEISETSPGISKDVLFQPTSAAASVGMSGLGMQLARKQIEQLGGEFRIVSSSAGSSTLRFTLPVAEAREERPLSTRGVAGVAPPKDGAFASMKLLVAEDSDDSFRVFEAYLKQTEHHISRALNGTEAVNMAKTGQYDIIVMDVNMPVMDGYTATSLIREWETECGRARAPILLLSADDAGRQMRIGAAVGCSGYLTKPTTKKQLLAALVFYARPTGLPSSTVN